MESQSRVLFSHHKHLGTNPPGGGPGLTAELGIDPAPASEVPPSQASCVCIGHGQREDECSTEAAKGYKQDRVGCVYIFK
jgi:hypothetical protein